MARTLVTSLLLVMWSMGLSASADEWSIDFENGIASNGFNRFRVPGTTGTDVTLTETLRVSPTYFARTRLSYHPNDRETWSLLYAPLTFRATGTSPTAIAFCGVNFPANTALNATYQFNSYRLTYRRDFHSERRLHFGLGLTAKIRDALIKLSSGNQTAAKTDIGFVPLLNFSAKWRLGKKWTLTLDGDALAGPVGRAEDIMLAFEYRLGHSTTIRAGYRVVEGGVDIPAVYNFSRIDYGLIGIERRF